MHVRHGTGYAPSAAAEKYVLAWHRKHRVGHGPGALLFHGSSDDATHVLSKPYGTGLPQTGIMKALTNAHVTCLSTDFGGLSPWANAASVARVQDGFNFLSQHAEPPFFLIAASMGAAVALNWAKDHLPDVAGLALLLPVADMKDAYDNDRGPGLRAQILAAYGSDAAWQAAEPTRNPVRFANVFTTKPTEIWYASNDPAAVPSRVEAFAASADAELNPLGPVGHNVSSAPTAEVSNFIRGLL